MTREILIMIWLFVLIVSLLVAIFLPDEDSPFFKKRKFLYYNKGELVGIEYRSYAEPAFKFNKDNGLGFPEYDMVWEVE